MTRPFHPGLPGFFPPVMVPEFGITTNGNLAVTYGFHPVVQRGAPNNFLFCFAVSVATHLRKARWASVPSRSRGNRGCTRRDGLLDLRVLIAGTSPLEGACRSMLSACSALKGETLSEVRPGAFCFSGNRSGYPARSARLSGSIRPAWASQTRISASLVPGSSSDPAKRLSRRFLID